MACVCFIKKLPDAIGMNQFSDSLNPTTETIPKRWLVQIVMNLVGEAKLSLPTDLKYQNMYEYQC